MAANPSVKTVKNLLCAKGKDLEALWEKAEKIRRENMGEAVHLRGIIEFSNVCRKDCNYCGINKSNRELKRYRMTGDEILAECKKMQKEGLGTVVLQSGEDPFYTKELLGEIIKRIRHETALAITLSVGERDQETYAYWKKCGMDRYLLRFETSDPKLFSFCHPDDDLRERLACLHTLQKLKIQTGSGFLIGIPGETLEQLAKDIIFCSKMKLEMIGVGPFIPHEKTKFGKNKNPFQPEVYFKTIAILRILNPKAHIPATTAFDAIQKNGRDLVLQRGANVFMPNCTPKKYRENYQLYPGKPCLGESSEQCFVCVKSRIKRIGRIIGTGRGDAFK